MGSKVSLWKTGTANLSPYAAPGLAPVPNSYPQPVSSITRVTSVALEYQTTPMSNWNVLPSPFVRRVTANGRPDAAQRLGLREQASLGCSTAGPAVSFPKNSIAITLPARC